MPLILNVTECPYCGYSWLSTGKGPRVRCVQCKKSFTKNKKYKFQDITCPHCNHSWKYTGDKSHIQCRKCKKFFKKDKQYNFRDIKCPHCGYSWLFTGKGPRVQCRKCKKWFRCTVPIKTSLTAKTVATAIPETNIPADNKMSGKIISELKYNEFPKKYLKEVLPKLIKDENIRYALAVATKEKRIKKEKIIEIALKEWLQKEGFL